MAGDSPTAGESDSTCLSKKCSQMKTAFGSGYSLCFLRLAGKACLRLAGNLERQEKMDITGKFQSKKTVKPFCVSTVIIQLLLLLVPGITGLRRQQEGDSEQWTRHTGHPDRLPQVSDT